MHNHAGCVKVRILNFLLPPQQRGKIRIVQERLEIGVGLGGGSPSGVEGDGLLGLQSICLPTVFDAHNSILSVYHLSCK